MNHTDDPVAVLGGGSWGTALAHLLAEAGHETRLVLRDAELAARIAAYHVNDRYLPDLVLNPGVCAGTDPAALEDASLVVLAVPVQALRETLTTLRRRFRPGAVLVNAAKGIEVKHCVTPSRIVGDVLPEFSSRYAVLSGPSFAGEVAARKPTAVVLGCADRELGARLRGVFFAPWFRAYSSSDVIGVELGGAVKNVIAVGAGLSDGLGFGHNARAALVARGLSEISRLGSALGARASTFMGLSGLGDLMLTCAGDCSRNRQVGLRLGRGESPDRIASSLHMVAEGVATTAAVKQLADVHGVDMPVTRTVYSVLYENLEPARAVRELMARPLREE